MKLMVIITKLQHSKLNSLIKLERERERYRERRKFRPTILDLEHC